MTAPTTTRLLPLAVFAIFLAGTAVFSAAYCQAPLYYSNQNQYFLHGLAAAGEGHLREDWLANTKDPTPVFSAVVAFVATIFPPPAFHVLYALVMGVYAASLFALFFVVAGQSVIVARWPVFLALLLLTHAALMRWLSYRLVGFDYPWFLQAGVAGQYVLGGMLQPSVFGVLLVTAVALFALERPILAAVAVGLAAILHSTYLLSGAMLILGFGVALLWERRIRTALAVGAVALILVSPVVVYILYQFAPSSPGEFAQAQDILVNFRIPHHARPDLWIDPIAVLQIAWIILGISLVGQTRLVLALGVPFVLATLLTLAQIASGSDTLALLFPWRLSAVLMPVATAVILTRLVALPSLPLGTRTAWISSAVVIAVLVGGGVWISISRSGFRGDDDELGMLAFVRAKASPGDVYFIPVRLPNLAKKTRGSLSSDFKPLAEKKKDAAIIPVDLQRFRLQTGVPIYVDFKSIPYKDREVIEWRKRLDIADAVARQIRANHLGQAVKELQRLKVTHLVWPANQELNDEGLKEVYGDSAYRVYRVRQDPQWQEPEASPTDAIR